MPGAGIRADTDDVQPASQPNWWLPAPCLHENPSTHGEAVETRAPTSRPSHGHCTQEMPRGEHMNSDSKQNKSTVRPFILGMALGAMAGTFGAYLHLSGSQAAKATQADTATNAECPSVDEKPAEATSPSPRNAKDFAFYDVLEKVPVTPTRQDLEQPPLPPHVAPTPAAPTKPAPAQAPAADRPFYLQAASFKAEGEAEALRARIALAGVKVAVVAMDIPEKGTYYRVRLGPFASKDEASQTTAQLVQSGIDLQNAFVVR